MTINDEHQTTVSEQPAFAAPSEAMPAGQSYPSKGSDGTTAVEKAELLKKMRDSLSMVQTDFQAKRSVAKEILRDSQAQYDKIMGMLNDQLHQMEIERARFETENVELRNNLRTDMSEKKQAAQQLAAVQAEKIAIEVKLKKSVGDVQVLGQEVTALKSELEKAKTLVEVATTGKKEIEKKLLQLQEHWDKYIAGS